MRNPNKSQIGLVLVVCSLVTMLSGAMFYRHHQNESTQALGRFSKAEIAAISVPLTQIMLPGVTVPETNIYQNTTFTTSGVALHYWDVNSFDPATGDNAHLLWDADSGELLRASHLIQKDQRIAYDAKTNRSLALRLGWDWFHALKIGRAEETWRIIGTRNKPYAQWELYIRTPDRFCILTISTASGQLVQAVCGHLPGINTAWNPMKTNPVAAEGA